jgi:hypothetical protein
MAAYPTPVFGAAYEAKIPFGGNVVKSVPRMEATRFDADIGDGCGAARGILFGLLLCTPFWVGAYLLFRSLG